MSKVEELIKKYCPDGVEYRALGELKDFSFINILTPGFTIKRKDYKKQGEFPVISQEAEFISGYYDKCDIKIPISQYVCFGDHTESVKYIDFQFVQGADGLKIISVDTKKIISKFLFYAIEACYEKRGKYERHFKYLLDTLIPLPPLPVQEEIVRILDTFTELEKELEKELVLRRKQYEYYRDLLLDFGHGDGGAYSVPWLSEMLHELCPQGVEYKKLGEVIQIKRGIRLIKKQLKKDGLYPVYQNSSIPLGYHDNYNCGANTTMVITAGAAGEVLYSNKRFWAADDCFYFICDERINEKFLYYILTSQQKEIYTKVRKASIPRLPRIAIENIIISLPPLAIQRRITAILDRFDALCNDLTSGLPAEIALRRKQYEYYRDKLLTFKELEKA